MKFKDLRYKIFGNLTVLSDIPEKDNRGKEFLYTCKCQCGKIIKVRGSNLTSGNTKKCRFHKNYVVTPEIREKMSKVKLGKKVSEETKRKISLAKKGKKYVLGKHWKLSDEIRKSMSERMKGEKHPGWIKDRTLIKQYWTERNNSEYKQWRKQVWLRDNFKCKIDNPDCKGRIEAHHIIGWTKFPELRYQINNGITLCHFHHPRVREEEKRLSPYFKELVSVSKD